AFSSNRKGLGRFHIYQKDLSGSGNEEVLFESDDGKFPQSWSSDGRFIAYVTRRMSSTAQTEIWVLPLISERKPFPLLQSQLNQGDPQFSPNGRFIAYTADESGSQQVYVRSFPGPGGKQQVSTVGGWNPHWRRDGKELFFLAEDKMVAVDVKSNGST